MLYSFVNKCFLVRESQFWNVIRARLSFLGSISVIGSLSHGYSVSQASILGPLSYNLFIDDMPLRLTDVNLAL